MKDDIILSPLQQKEMQEEKAKELEEKRKLFIVDIEEVQDKHKMKIQAVLNFNVNGVLPNLIIVPMEEKKPNEVSSVR